MHNEFLYNCCLVNYSTLFKTVFALAGALLEIKGFGGSAVWQVLCETPRRVSGNDAKSADDQHWRYNG